MADMNQTDAAHIRLELVRMFGDKMGYEGIKQMADFIFDGTVPVPPPVEVPAPAPQTKARKKR